MPKPGSAVPRRTSLATGALARRASLATIALALALMALSSGPVGSLARPAVSRARGAARENLPNAFEPQQPRLAYLTETATSTPKVWLASASGREAKLLGPGQQPLLAPDGQLVAVSLFGVSPGVEEHGPALGIYPASGAPMVDYLNLEAGTASPLAWSQDSRYLAVYVQSTQTVGVAAASSLDVIDTQSGTVTTIAKGAIYGASFAHDGSDKLVFGLSHSESFAGGVNLYTSEPDGAGLHRLTSDGRSLNPVWGPTYIAYDRERMRKLSPEYQIWLASPSGVRVRRLTHLAVGSLVQGLVPLAFSVERQQAAGGVRGRGHDRRVRRRRRLRARSQRDRPRPYASGRGHLQRRQHAADRRRRVRAAALARAHRDDPVRRRALEGARRARLAGQLERLTAIASAAPSPTGAAVRRGAARIDTWPRSR